MRWPLSEYLLKGVFLGLLVYAGLTVPVTSAVGGMAAGLAAGLLIAAGDKLRRGIRPTDQLLGFPLFVLLESPGLIYAGVVVGLAVVCFALTPDIDRGLLTCTLGGGMVLGVGMAYCRNVPRANTRLGVAIGAAALIVATVIATLLYIPGLLTEDRQRALGTLLLAGVPFFYLLTFVGSMEEHEGDAAAWGALLAVGLWLVRPTPISPVIGLLAFVVYVRLFQPSLRVFKHTLRGRTYARLGHYPAALAALRRATRLDPANRAAREALWEVHRDLDAAKIAAEPRLVELIDPHLCLDRAATLLLADRPSAGQRAEAAHLLDLVVTQAPALSPQIDYWRAVAETHAGNVDGAADLLRRVLDPEARRVGDPSRQSVIVPAWQLALTLHPELNRRVGSVALAKPGRRLEAIAAVERSLAQAPEDAEIWKLKRLLYSDLTEVEFDTGPVGEFDYGYTEQLGLALLNDSARWRRGAEYLQIAARGMPHNAPSLHTKVAAAHERAGDADEARRAMAAGKKTGLAVGHKSLPETERTTFFALVRRLAEDAHARGDFRAAVEDYQLFTQSERAGLETYRTLAELHEKLGDALAALRVTEQALVYNAKDRDLLERKDRYYFSVMPEQLRTASEQYKQAIDVRYCLTKARQILEHRDSDFDSLQWAQHLIALAEVVQPASTGMKVMLGRARLRLGERDEAVAVLESVRAPKPEKFATDEDQDAWYVANRLLGDLYLKELDRPDLAVECFTAYRSSSKSGADTLYKLGQAYEAVGEARRAAKFYEQVTAFDEHPLAPEAREALMRVKQ
jgi:tetratricopeptide (TPR) repeat protein